MNDDHDVLIPMPLRDFLAGLRETKRAAVAQGFRLTVTNARESLDTITRRFVSESPEMPLIRDDVIPGARYTSSRFAFIIPNRHRRSRWHSSSTGVGMLPAVWPL